jgi:PAS domain S-box-containing protein
MQKGRTIIRHEKNSKASFLEGGGKMGELIRTFDWEKTSLGSPENWPQSLKTCVRIMLTSRQPIWIGWGRDLIKLYNDPYKAIVGGKHPWALGQPASVVWKDIWEDIEPMLKTVMEKDEGTYVESQLLIMDRNGYLEETYYTFSYTPIPGDKGGTAGMICANTDDTIRIIGERQLRTLRDLGKGLAKMQTVTEVYQNALKILEENQKDFPFAVLYKADNEGRTAQAIAYAGFDRDQDILPSHIDLLNPVDGTLNLCKAFSKKEIVVSENKGRRKNLPKGAWEIEPSHFVHIPIITSSSNHPSAVLTAGLNPYRIYNEAYKQFTTLVADQIALEVNNVTAYEQERKKAEALAEIDKAKTVFFSNISHEFRTPLTLMLGPLEDLLSSTQSGLSDEEKNQIETTHRNSMRLLRLVNNLLDFSRIEAGRAKAQFQLTDISAFTRDLAGSFRSAIENAGLDFNVNCDQVAHPIYVDRSMWEKIVLNLLSNAFKFTMSGSVTVSLSVKNNNAELSVRDTGAGIPEEELPNLFQRFHRVQNVTGRTFEGTGIGLSLVSEFVKMHGGNISVSSKINTGSEFVVSIPTGRNHLPNEQIDESDTDPELRLTDTFVEEAKGLIGAPAINKADQTGKIHDTSYILVVDDNTDMREYLKSVLKRNFTVVTANNGSDALQLIQEQAPQLVVSDVMMPVMDGIQLLKAIKENKKYQRIPVILLTARAGEESRIEGYQIGADDYLVKPFSTKELLARITTQLSMREKIEENEKQLEYFIKRAPVGIAIYKGPDFIVEGANDRVLEMWGKTLDEVKGKTLTDIFPEITTQEDARALYEVSVEKFLRGETFVVNEAEFVFQRDGRPYRGWYNCTYEPVKDQSGNGTGVIAVVTEVTDQVIARKKIEESEDKFRTLATEFPLFVWLTDDKLRTTFLNKTGLEYFNVSQATNIAELSWKKFIHPDDIERVLAVMNNAARDHKSYTLTMRLKNGKTGEYRWFVDNGVPQYENGNFSGFIGTSMDIHEQKTADEKIRQSEEKYRQLSMSLEERVSQRTEELRKLNEADKLKSDFIKMASHELKTPVTSIKGYTQLLLSALKEDESKVSPLLVRSSLISVDKQITRLTRLMSELLDLSKIEAGLLVLNKELFNLNELVIETVQDILYTNSKHDINIFHDFECEVDGDKDRIGQVLINFLTNAIKYSPNADKVEVWIRQLGKNRVSVSVKDFGIGIDEKDHEKIFERFYRAGGKEEQTFPGFGIGLFIAKEIIERHGGTIVLTSEKGRGSVFTFTLPAADCQTNKNE